MMCIFIPLLKHVPNKPEGRLRHCSLATNNFSCPSFKILNKSCRTGIALVSDGALMYGLHIVPQLLQHPQPGSHIVLQLLQHPVPIHPHNGFHLHNRTLHDHDACHLPSPRHSDPHSYRYIDPFHIFSRGLKELCLDTRSDAVLCVHNSFYLYKIILIIKCPF